MIFFNNKNNALTFNVYKKQLFERTNKKWYFYSAQDKHQKFTSACRKFE